MFDNIDLSNASGSGSGSALVIAILHAIVFLTETDKKAVTPEQIALYLNSKKGFSTDRKEVRRALQKVRSTEKATAENGRFTQELKQHGIVLNYSTGQGCTYAGVKIESKGKNAKK